MTTFYIFLQWARPGWILLILASAAFISLLITALSAMHGWLADQFFMLDETEQTTPTDPPHIEIPVRFQMSGD